jgi:ABC-type multidrug transport system ATPase subunit
MIYSVITLSISYPCHPLPLYIRSKDTVRTEFGGVTVLSIAHRLHTIAFFDKVLVMDKGSAAEFDSPLALMNQEGSIFRSMCDRSGDGDLLRRVATKKSKEDEEKKALHAAYDDLRDV